ncbi:hypothetical protein ALC57_09387 [Trachymyrmex cornetzi]|uniref:Uncharacterized protein n=1 Tax=Trachymyrmex cornetzi TaxID=471704 RepID=A0A195DZF3_9HYME|nr:hypothetical protein ALC57_09387 [Trachymyrmex cornetzi]
MTTMMTATGGLGNREAKERINPRPRAFLVDPPLFVALPSIGQLVILNVGDKRGKKRERGRKTLSRGGFVFRKTLSLVLPMPMLINYSLTNAAPPRDFECDKEKDAAGVSGARRQHKERDCDVEAEVSELETSKDRGRFKGLRAIQARSTLHPQTASPSTEPCLSSQSYRGMGETPIHQLEESKEEEKAKEEVDEDPSHIASKSLASELISLVLGHVDVDVTTNERER